MIIECAYCEGTGHKYGRNDSTVCPVCDGNGKVNAPSENYTCDYCKGTGHKYGRRDSTICSVCNGIGVTKINDFT